MPKKGLESSMNLIIAIVVLIVVALAVITLVLNNINDVDEDLNPTEDAAACGIWKQTACTADDSGIKNHPTIEGCQVDCG